MRLHLRSAALACALLACAVSAPSHAVASRAQPPGIPTVAGEPSNYLVIQNAPQALVALATSELLAQLPQPRAAAQHASDVIPAMEAIQPAFAVIRRQRARAPARSRLTSLVSLSVLLRADNRSSTGARGFMEASGTAAG